jgi:short-subunit dehydrogenase
MNLQGKTALVTGASSGIGTEFARQLGKKGADLVIVARRRGNLEALAKEIEEASKVRVTVIEMDLSEPGAGKRLFEQTEGVGRTIDVLVNNAGGGVHQNFLDMDWDRVARQVQLNVVTLTELTWRVGRAMRDRKGGHILNVASIGAYTPTPTYATYSAGKAFVRDFSEAIAYELRGSGVKVLSLCPGGTTTEFHQAAGHELPKIFKSTFMSAKDCAAVGLSALLRGRRNIISGVMNKVAMWMLRFMPRRAIVWFAAKSMGIPKQAALPAKSAAG